MNNKLTLLIIFVFAVLMRIYFQIGHVFSDDAYYSYLAYTIFKGNFPGNYLGYPIFLLRVGQTALMSYAFVLFGTNITATIIFPFAISCFNILLTYSLTKLITRKETTAIIASVLMAFFPTDVIFATIAFPDLINAFLINLGIYFLWKAYLKQSLRFSLFAGIFFFLSCQFKENIYYYFILLIVLLYYVIKNKNGIGLYILVPLVLIVLNFIIEGFIYYLSYGNFLYRLDITSKNYIYSYYDFFPYTAQKFLEFKGGFWRALFYQIFYINVKSIFLRRFYLFLPVAAVFQSIKNILNKKYLLLIFWFLGLAVLMSGFTTSFTSYKPLDLHRNWYIYPLIMPAVILSAYLINSLKGFFRGVLLFVYIVFSFVMCNEYQTYFNENNSGKFINSIRNSEAKTIFTDHFTKYSIDLIRNYKSPNKTKQILGADFNWSTVKKNDWVIFDKKHIDELKLQKYKFPNFTILNSDSFKVVSEIGEFKTFEKIN